MVSDLGRRAEAGQGWLFTPLGLRVAALAVVFAIGGVSPSPAGAAFRGANGLIAFTASHRLVEPCPPGSAQSQGMALEEGIFTMKASGREATELTYEHSGPACDFVSPPPTVTDVDPAFSPGGERIAFARSVETIGGGSSSQIYVMGADGSNPHLLSVGEHDSEPAFFPSGSRIAFVREPKCGNRRIDVVRADGTGGRRLVDGLGENPAIFPSGTRIAFDVPRSACVAPTSRDLFTIGTRGADRERLTQTGHSLAPDVSPSGSRIVFTGADDTYLQNVFVMPADGGHARRLARLASDPVFSPQGGKIAFTNHTRGSIVEMRADGFDKRPITPDPLPFGVARPSEITVGQPSWGPAP
jgi:dipeptidyl aminopeptidase/acylaminoacyl peptidase